MDTTTGNDIRDTLSASFDVVSEENAAAEALETPTSGTESTPEQSYEPSGDNHSPEDEKVATEAEKQAREYNRDEAGKFAAKEAEKAAKAAKEAQPKQEMTAGPKAGPKDPTERAPQAWKPAAREHWAQIPKEAREEIVRHEAQVQQTLRETAEVRRYADAVNKTLEPYRHFIKAEGSSDFQAIDNMMAAAAKLRTGTSGEIAQFVSAIINQYGVGRFGNNFISQLDSTLSGNIPAQMSPEMSAMEQRMRQIEEQNRSYQDRERQAYEYQENQRLAAAQSELDAFAASHEFLEDLRPMMADLEEMANARGQSYPLEHLYDMACRAHPEISKIIQQREQARVAQTMTQTAQKARSAAVSVGGSPAVAAPDVPLGSIRDAIQFALHQNTR